MTIPRSPSSVHETRIYRKITEMDNDHDGVLSKADRFIEVANPILDSIIAGPFKQYTLHNRDHAKKLVHLSEYVVSRDTIECLSSIECLLIIYSCYLHDMGLALTEEDVNYNLKSDEFLDVIRGWPQLQRALDERRVQLSYAVEHERARLESEIMEMNYVALTHCLRPKHATRARYKELIERIRHAIPGEDPFLIRGVSIEDELIDICESHNLDAARLGEFKNAHEDCFQRRFVIADHVANIQFIAALLRLTDILDFDFERTPQVLFESLGLRNRNLPDSDVSLMEWEKHLSVQQLEIRDGELVVKAQCSHPSVESTVRKFCTTIEDEIRRTLSVVKRNNADISDRYRFRLPTNVRAEIKSRGYIFIDLALSLDESAVMSLLMGTKLYRTPYAAIRELIQNAVDACLVRQQLRKDLGPGMVEVFSEKDSEDKTWICVRDNGIGMNEYVLRQYFFRVGKSYYNSHEFDCVLRANSIKSIPLVSRFGIGFLASFMLADLIEVETRPVSQSPQMPVEQGLRVAVERLGALAYVQENDRLSKGTTIRLRLKNSIGDADDVIYKISDYIKSSVLRPSVTVKVDSSSRNFRIDPNDYYELLDKPLSPKEVPIDKFKIIELTLDKYSDIFRGKAILFFVENDENKTLDIKFGDRPLEFGSVSSFKNRISIPPHFIFKQFGGNRITVGGFRMMFPKLGRLLRQGLYVVPVVFDIDIVPTQAIEFDVARTRIIDENLSVRIPLKEAIERGIKDLGLWDQMSKTVQKAIRVKSPNDPFRLQVEVLRRQGNLVDDEAFLKQVEELVPKDKWPVGLHRIIAEEIGMAGNKVYSAMSTLIVEGRIKNPNSGNPGG